MTDKEKIFEFIRGKGRFHFGKGPSFFLFFDCGSFNSRGCPLHFSDRGCSCQGDDNKRIKKTIADLKGLMYCLMDKE